jgi:hypothetical protein
MRPIDALSPQEKEILKEYIKQFGTPKHEAPEDIDHVLRFWNNEKIKLFNLFGKELILQRDFGYEIEEHDLIQAFEFNFNQNPKVQGLINKLMQLSPDLRFVGDITAEMYANNYFGLPTQHIDLPGQEKALVIPTGSKIMRMLQKICKAFNLEEQFTSVMNLHSQVLNVKEIRGTLNLSIHPMDYLTLSDTPYKWSTCMSWCDHIGDYRAGCVEMLNSPSVVVAYISGPKDLYISDDKSWPGGKKWRSLFIVDDDFIASIKGYPFICDPATIAAMKWLMELKGWDEKGIFPFTNNHFTGKGLDIAFDANLMYNDFDNSVKNFITVNPELKAKQTAMFWDYNYSGVMECMVCGKEYSNNAELDQDFAGKEQFIGCPDCSPRYQCAKCGGYFVNIDNMVHVDDYGEVCNFCFDELVVEDVLTGEPLFEPHAIAVSLLDDEDWLIDTIYFDKNISDEEWDKYFDCPKPKYNCLALQEMFLTQAAKELFDLTESNAN